MPLPNPKKKETKKEWDKRCMSNPTMMKEFPSKDQRYAVCQSQWKKKDNKSESNVTTFTTKADTIGYADASIKDILLVKFKLCHANKNGNFDVFTSEELRKSYYTSVGKAIDMAHDYAYTIGYIYKSTFIDVENKKTYTYENDEETIVEDANLKDYGYKKGEDSFIYCEAKIWQMRFPEEAQAIKEDFDDDALYFSMETYFEECECEFCGQISKSSKSYCQHLRDRFNLGCGRILIGCTFAGAGKVDYPADIDAIGLAAAKHDFNILDLISDENFDNETLNTLLSIKMESL